MQHPPTDKVLKQRSKIRRGPDGKELNSLERYAADKLEIFEGVRNKLGSEWFAPFPLVNPHKIIEESKTSPMSAAFMCQYACGLISKMEERKVREYVAAAYFIACDMKLNERAILSLAGDVQDRRYKNGVPTEVVKEDILHYLFLYIYYQSGIRTRDRATQYAQGLKEYFYEGRRPELVSNIIAKHGPDRLRRVAQRKAKLIEGAQEWVKQGKNPGDPTFDEVLTTLAAEETKAVTTDETDETFDHGSRDLPPDLSDNEDPGVSDDDIHGDEDEHDTGNGEQQAPDVAADDDTASGKKVVAGEKGNDTDEAGFIDGDVIDERLQQILLGTMSIGAILVTQPLEPDVKKHVLKMTVQLSNDLLYLRRRINDV